MFSRFWGIVTNSFTETIRQPIYGILLLVTIGMLVFNVAISGYTMDDDNKLLKDLGLSTLLLSGLFLAAFSSAGILSREIENKTVLTVISKPVSRPLFLSAKFTGLAGALGLAFYLTGIAFLLCMRACSHVSPCFYLICNTDAKVEGNTILSGALVYRGMSAP